MRMLPIRSMDPKEYLSPPTPSIGIHRSMDNNSFKSYELNTNNYLSVINIVGRSVLVMYVKTVLFKKSEL